MTRIIHLLRAMLNILQLVLITAIVLVLIALMTSCAPSGYGCRGTGKIMTRVQSQSW